MAGARDTAARALARIWKDDAFAAPVLEAEVARAGLDARDAALATELVLGVLRTEDALERRLVRAAGRGRLDVKGEARAALLSAAYALSYLRAPPFAVVSEAVRIVRAARGERVAGFANAILRKLAAAPVEADLAADALASLPAWLRERVEAALGADGARALVGGAAPPTGLAVLEGSRDAWIERLREAAPEAMVAAGRVSPRAILLSGAGKVSRLPGVGRQLAVQEEGAQVIALAVRARPGERILDACAGRGNKTLLLAGDARPGGEVVATDLSASKLERATRADGVTARAHDWTTPAPALGLFDAVLVDAPCTGTGTLGRRPEIARRRRPEDVARLAELQCVIARHAAERLRPGGRLVFATCSVLPEEGEQVVARLAAEAGLALAPFEGTSIPALEGKAEVRLSPAEHGTDGYFLARLVRRG